MGKLRSKKERGLTKITESVKSRDGVLSFGFNFGAFIIVP